MNDFTIEELTELHRCLKYIINGRVTPYSCVTVELKKKIKSMIDNYSELKLVELCCYCLEPGLKCGCKCE